VIDARGGGMGPRGGLAMGPRVAIPGGLGIAGVILFVAIQLLSGGGGASGFGVDNQFGQTPELGTSDEVNRLRREQPDEANALSVRLELQADCYAGVWAHSVFAAGDLERGDVQEAVRASAAVGDDRLQRKATGQVDPDSFTHGSSEQRAAWFNRGRESGEPAGCDTFSPETL
jgi:predicted metalloprotease